MRQWQAITAAVATIDLETPSRVAGWCNREVVARLCLQPTLLRKFIATAPTQHAVVTVAASLAGTHSLARLVDAPAREAAEAGRVDFAKAVDEAVPALRAADLSAAVQAQEFLRDYYASAVRPASAERAWQMLKPEFRLVLPGGYDGFSKWYTNWRKVELGELQRGGEINQFMTAVTYVSADNQVQSRGEGAWTISCANAIQSYNPFDSTCSVRDIQIDYYGYQQNP